MAATATVAAQISSSLCCYSSARETLASSASKTASSPHLPRKFSTGSSLLIQRPFYRRNSVWKSKSISIRCEQSNAADVWLGRLAMVGFASAISIEISTGKGLLENFGVASPLSTVALAVTVLVGVLTAVFIFQSSSEN